jgi:hypothetical protein
LEGTVKPAAQLASPWSQTLQPIGSLNCASSISADPVYTDRSPVDLIGTPSRSSQSSVSGGLPLTVARIQLVLCTTPRD